MEFSFSHLVRNCSDAIKFQEVFVQFCCRSPHGERGLKSVLRIPVVLAVWSLPTRGVWIEILAVRLEATDVEVAPLTESVNYNLGTEKQK